MLRNVSCRFLRAPNATNVVFSRAASLSSMSARRTAVAGSTKTLINTRWYSDKSGASGNGEAKNQSSSSQPSQPSNSGKGRLLLILGLLAIGSTVASINYQKNDPAEFLEEKSFQDSEGKPLFSDNQISVIFVLGGPGSGKGTQCAKLVQNHQFVHLSAGDLLRAEQAREGSQYGALIKKYITEGQIVPQEITVQLLKQAIESKYKEGKTRFLVDGFPRKMDQAITFEKVVAPSKFTLFFECPEKVMLERLLERGKTSGRDDDNIESIKKRFKTFIDTSMPVVEHFEKQSKVVRVRCDEPVDTVYDHVETAINDKI
ncbi:hypothetical protein ZYGR_0AK00140 [Zygosaccharomyces rouxii]|uniref:Uridylate kinase n=1 Tax=Zygosaccharomyces rouxii TaxID=4956 RepID=A0A1Q3ACU7_ZYGRO|nr:hypothetical protein ZYGR_0AK00140 [Zygosaccharomyces rouxii]